MLFHWWDNLMNLQPNDLMLFARVVDEGSFSRAAERLDVPKSTLSRRVAALETDLGERLLLRTTRKLTVTDFGRAVLEHAHHVVEDVKAAESIAHSRQAAPNGRLRVTMPGDMGNNVLAPVLADFVLKYPAITLEVDLTARFVDLVGENFDVAIRMGELRDDATLVARRFAAFSGSLYAAPAYVERRGMPTEPDALMTHDTLRVLARGGDALPWVLLRKATRWEGNPSPRATVNSPELLMRMALNGAGVAVVSDHIASPYLQRGELVQVLPDWRTPPVSAWALYQGRRLLPARTRVFLEALAAAFTDEKCQAIDDDVQKLKARAVSMSSSSRAAKKGRR